MVLLDFQTVHIVLKTFFNNAILRSTSSFLFPFFDLLNSFLYVVHLYLCDLMLSWSATQLFVFLSLTSFPDITRPIMYGFFNLHRMKIVGQRMDYLMTFLIVCEYNKMVLLSQTYVCYSYEVKAGDIIIYNLIMS